MTAPGPIAAEVLAALVRLGERVALPPVKALHLPPAAAAPADAEFCALELADGSLGLSYVLLGDTRARLAPLHGGRPLAGAPALEVARAFAEGAGAGRAVGYAAVNALSAFLLARAGYVPEDAGDSLGLLAPRPGDHVGMIGYFPSLAARVVAAGARLTVLELRADLAGERDGFRVTLDPAALGACNKVLSTSTVLLNDTLDRVVAACGRAATFAVVGPGAGLLPDALFARGVTLVGGTAVVDRPAFLAALASGERWGGATRKFTIRREAYPGLEALLRRV